VALTRLHPHFKKAAGHSEDPAQHAAVVELLILAVYAGKTVDVRELEALDEFDASHADWDAGPFSIQQYLAPATAKVRGALDEPDGADRLLADAASRITTPALRDATLHSCEELLRIDGMTDDEREFFAQASRALSNLPHGPEAG
jgi:hypothetical protein